MSDTTQRWAKELNESVEMLKTMRDEVKVQMHLGSLEAKERFAALEARLENEGLAAQHKFKELLAGFRDVKDQLKATKPS